MLDLHISKASAILNLAIKMMKTIGLKNLEKVSPGTLLNVMKGKSLHSKMEPDIKANGKTA